MEQVSSSSSSTMTISHLLIIQAALVNEQYKAFICTSHTHALAVSAYSSTGLNSRATVTGSQFLYQCTTVPIQTYILHKFIQILGHLLACISIKEQQETPTNHCVNSCRYTSEHTIFSGLSWVDHKDPCYKYLCISIKCSKTKKTFATVKPHSCKSKLV